MVCLPGTSTGQARRVAERLLATIEDSPVALSDDVEVAVTAQIGIAGIDERTSVQEAVDHAVRIAGLAVAGAGDAIAIWDPGQSG